MSNLSLHKAVAWWPLALDCVSPNWCDRDEICDAKYQISLNPGGSPSTRMEHPQPRWITLNSKCSQCGLYQTALPCRVVATEAPKASHPQPGWITLNASSGFTVSFSSPCHRNQGDLKSPWFHPVLLLFLVILLLFLVILPWFHHRVIWDHSGSTDFDSVKNHTLPWFHAQCTRHIVTS